MDLLEACVFYFVRANALKSLPELLPTTCASLRELQIQTEKLERMTNAFYERFSKENAIRSLRLSKADKKGVATRKAYGREHLKLGEQYKRVMALVDTTMEEAFLLKVPHGKRKEMRRTWAKKKHELEQNFYQSEVKVRQEVLADVARKLQLPK
jgi:hypothetical protein